VNNENLEKGAPHRFKTGQSGNPGGRPKRRPIFDRYAAMAELSLPEEERIKYGLPGGASYGHALVARTFKDALEGNPYAAREIHEAIEGKTGQRQETGRQPNSNLRGTDSSSCSSCCGGCFLGQPCFEQENRVARFSLGSDRGYPIAG
jgi:hypothetical protein